MAIEFACRKCKQPLRAAEAMAGKAIRCPKCEAMQPVPAARTEKAKPKETEPSAGIDWSLMEEAAKETMEVTAADAKEEAGAVDWDAIARGGEEESPREKRKSEAKAQAAPAARGEKKRYGEKVGAVGGRFDKFITESFFALPYGATYLPPIVFLIITMVIMGLVMPLIASGGVFLLQKFPSDQLAVALLLILIVPQLCFLGYVWVFWTQITDTTAEDSDLFGLPPFTVLGTLAALAMVFVFFIIYVLPIITLPLAPMAFLILSRTNDARAFNPLLVARLTFQHFGYVIVTILFIIAFQFIGGIVAVIAFPYVSKFALSMAGKGLTAQWANAVAAEAMFFTAMPIMMWIVASQSRAIGLIGKYNPHILQFLPPRSATASLIGLATTAGAIALSGLVVYPYLANNNAMITGVQKRFTATEAIDLSDRTAPVPKPDPDQPGKDATKDRPESEPERLPDFSKMSPREISAYHLKSLRGDDLGKQKRALDWFAVNSPAGEDRSEVVALAMKQMTQGRWRDEGRTVVQKWNEDSMRVTMLDLRSPDKSRREAALKAVQATAISDNRRDEIAAALADALSYEVDRAQQEALFRTYLMWSKEPFEVAKLELMRNRPYVQPIAEAIAKSGHRQASGQLARHIVIYPQTKETIMPLLRPLIASNPAVNTVDYVLVGMINEDERRSLTALELLKELGTPKAVLPLRKVKPASRNIEVAIKSTIQHLAPNLVPKTMSEALAEYEKVRKTGQQAREDAMVDIKAIEPNDADRALVLKTLLPHVLEGGEINIDAADVVGAWADDATFARLLRELAASKKSAQKDLLIRAIGATNRPPGIAPIVEALDGNTSAAVAALSKMGPMVEDQLIQLIRSGATSYAKQGALNVLGRVGTEKSIPLLEELAAGGDVALKTLAEPALKSVKDRMKAKG